MTVARKALFDQYLNDSYEPLFVPVLERACQPAELLEELDPELYLQKRRDWDEGQLFTALGQDSLSHAQFTKNEERFRWLARLVARERVLPFVGAGVSAACGLLTWSQYLKKIAGECRFAAAKLDKMLKRGAFDAAATTLLQRLGEPSFREVFDRAFGAARPLERTTLPEALLALFRGPVVTTNYDQVLERCRVPAFDQTFLGSHPGEFQRACREGQRVLFKIHGNLYEPASRVLTTAEYDAAYGGPTSMLAQTMRTLFLRETVLFVGASLSSDRTMNLIRDLAQDPHEGPLMRHFAILEQPEQERMIAQRESFLAERCIFPIWYPPRRHEVVLELIEQLGIAAEEER